MGPSTQTKPGSLPPPSRAWQAGKTAASIRFVLEVERSLDTRPAHEQDLLRAAVDAIKGGRLILNSWTSPEEYLALRG